MTVQIVKPPRLKRDYIGHAVMLKRPVQTANDGIIPSGSIGRILHHFKGRTEITFGRCPHCHVKPVVRWLRYGADYDFVVIPATIGQPTLDLFEALR